MHLILPFQWLLGSNAQGVYCFRPPRRLVSVVYRPTVLCRIAKCTNIVKCQLLYAPRIFNRPVLAMSNPARARLRPAQSRRPVLSPSQCCMPTQQRSPPTPPHPSPCRGSTSHNSCHTPPLRICAGESTHASYHAERAHHSRMYFARARAVRKNLALRRMQTSCAHESASFRGPDLVIAPMYIVGRAEINCSMMNARGMSTATYGSAFIASARRGFSDQPSDY